MFNAILALVRRYVSYRQSNKHVMLDMFDYNEPKRGMRSYSVRTK